MSPFLYNMIYGHLLTAQHPVYQLTFTKRLETKPISPQPSHLHASYRHISTTKPLSWTSWISGGVTKLTHKREHTVRDFLSKVLACLQIRRERPPSTRTCKYVSTESGRIVVRTDGRLQYLTVWMRSSGTRLPSQDGRDKTGSTLRLSVRKNC